jgi:tRNA dimethylallyltransferase
MSKLICIIGPTASGKTAAAIDLASKTNGEIVNADSRQFYQEMNIGTAKPSKDELAEIPHHLINVASIQEAWSAAKFVDHAKMAIADIASRGKQPILVGGTGLYVKSLLFGLDEIPQVEAAIRDQIKEDLVKLGLPALYQELQKVDVVSAQRLSENDSQRIMRALEVYRQTGNPIHSYWKQQKTPTMPYLKIGFEVDRDVLYARINKRVIAMLDLGLQNEAQELFKNYPDNEVLLKTIGYAEWAKFGFDQVSKVCDHIQKNTRHFAKRQLTWFRNEDDVQWLDSQDMALHVKCWLEANV